MKNCFLQIITLLFLLHLTGVRNVSAQNSGNVGGINWEFYGDGILTVGGATDIFMNFLDNASFNHIRNQIRHVVVEHGVTSIGTFAFQSDFIETITLPATLTAFAVQSFENCTALHSINVVAGNPYYYSDDGVIFSKLNAMLVACPPGKTGAYYVPDTVEIIDRYAFRKCSKLTSVILPPSVKIISDYAFQDSRIITVTLPASLISIGIGAFTMCNKLTTVNIPASVSFIGDAAFRFCDNLTSISVDTGNPVYSSIDGVLFDTGKQSLVVCPQQKKGSYIVPEGIKIIEVMAFCYCYGLTSITFSSSVTTLDIGALANCVNLKSIALPASIQIVNYQAFYCCDNLTEIINFSNSPQNISVSWLPSTAIAKCTLRVPAAAVGKYLLANNWKDFKEIVAIEEKIALDYNEIYLLSGNVKTVNAELTGGAANPKAVVWNSRQPEVVTVNNGKLTAVHPGTSVITASIDEGEVECSVSVIEKGKMLVDRAGVKMERAKLYVK